MKKDDFQNLAETARQTSLAGYFRQSGYSLERCGSEIYIKEYPGLCINSKTNAWYNHYTNEGGYNSIDCLVKILGMDFKQAVHVLTGQDISRNPSQSYMRNPYPTRQELPIFKPKPDFKMPEHDVNMRRVFAYLCKERKIPAEIVAEFAQAKLLYQSRSEIQTTVGTIPQTFKKCNAVFVHLNEYGEAVGGEIQGINSYKRYKGIVAGTGESAFSFTPNPTKDRKIKTAYFFESAIDLMSFYSFCDKKKLNGTMLTSLAGLKPTIPKKLQEQGIIVLSCVDNDEAGRKFEKDNGFNRATDLLEKANVKDWNELLCKTDGNSERKSINKDLKKSDGRTNR